MTTILMCKPDYFGIEYEINPWMHVQQGAELSLAIEQWQGLFQAIKQCGAEVALVPSVRGLPDLVFTANAALFYNHQVYLARFKYPERQREHDEFQRWFTSAGYTILPEPKDFLNADGDYIGPSFEGAGDALFAGSTLVTAYGFRSDRAIYPYLSKIFNIKKLILCELVDPYYYHLDTCFCPLNEQQAIWYPAAFSPETQQRLPKELELFAIPQSEARHFACNAVVINNNVIIPTLCPKTREILEKLNFTVYEQPMSEFIKSGGACKCLTLNLS